MYMMYEMQRDEPLYTGPDDDDGPEEQDGQEEARTGGFPAG